MSGYQRFRLLSFAGVLAACVFVLVGCAGEVVGGGVLTPANFLEDTTDKLPGDEQVVEARLVVHPSGCVGAVVDGVERFPVWPVGTKKDHIDYEGRTFQITIPGGPTIETSPDSPAKIRATGIVDTDQTLFGIDPNREAFVDPGRTDWQPASLFISFCGLEDVGPIAFPDPTRIEVVQ